MSELMHHPQGFLLPLLLALIIASSYRKSSCFWHSIKSARLFLMPVSVNPMSVSICLSSRVSAAEEYVRRVCLKKASGDSLSLWRIGKNMRRSILFPSLMQVYSKVTGDFLSSSPLAASTTYLMKSLLSAVVSPRGYL